MSDPEHEDRISPTGPRGSKATLWTWLLVACVVAALVWLAVAFT